MEFLLFQPGGRKKNVFAYDITAQPAAIYHALAYKWWKMFTHSNCIFVSFFVVVVVRAFFVCKCVRACVTVCERVCSMNIVHVVDVQWRRKIRFSFHFRQSTFRFHSIVDEVDSLKAWVNCFVCRRTWKSARWKQTRKNEFRRFFVHECIVTICLYHIHTTSDSHTHLCLAIE